MTAQRRQDDTLRDALERLLEKWEAKSRKPTFDEFDRLVCDTYESRASDLRAVLAAHPAPEPGRCTCGLPGCSDDPDAAGDEQSASGVTDRPEVECDLSMWSDEDDNDIWLECVTHDWRENLGNITTPTEATVAFELHVQSLTSPTDPAGSVTAGEPRVCGERYGVQPGICRKPEGHQGWHSDGTGQWPVEPVPSPAPDDEREALARIIWSGRFYSDCGNSTAHNIIAAGWRSPTEVAALVADAERRTRGQVAREIERDIKALRVDISGPQMVRYNCAAIARAATKAAS